MAMPVLDLVRMAIGLDPSGWIIMLLIVLFIIHIFGLSITFVAVVNTIIHAIFLLCGKCFIAVVLQCPSC